jgi:pSer/pThr/pTyr-binding forkhead associated (FHA) protein
VSGFGGDEASRKISGSHLEVAADARGAYLTDLESRGGTTSNGVKLAARTRTPLRSEARVRIANVLDLEVRVVPGTQGPAAVVVTRSSNRADHAYALVRERLPLSVAGGAVKLGAGTTAIAPAPGGFAIDGIPLKPGVKTRAGGLEVEAREVRPEDMK